MKSWTVLVYQGYHNKVTQTKSLKMTAIYFLTFLEARSPKLRCWQMHAPSEGSKEAPLLQP